MKYNNQIQTKNRLKKALLVTATTMTLGLGIVGGTTSAFAAESIPIPLVDNSKLQQSPESPEERMEMHDAIRDWYQNNEEEKTLTVLIAADEQYREAHPDWQELTTQLLEEGSKDFKEYYNIKYVPVEFFEWQSHGAQAYDIYENLKGDYISYIADHPEYKDRFSAVMFFTENKRFTYGGVVFEELVGTDESESAIPLIAINGNEEKSRYKDIPTVIKHELTHTFGIHDDNDDLRNSIMSFGGTNIEWSSTEMEVINENRDRYPNREV